MIRKQTLSLLLSAGLAVGSSYAVAAESAVDDKDLAGTDKVLALESMAKMSTYLRSLQSFAVQAHVNVDQVLENGQKVQLTESVQVVAEKPDKLWLESKTMTDEQEFFFDGKIFTLYTPTLGYYSSVEVPGTIEELVVKIQDEYDVRMPLADLFLWGTKEDHVASVDEAMVVGINQVNGVSCDHFAFRQKEIDWQVCIERDETPLPLKLVVTLKEEQAQPQYVAVMKWNTAPYLEGSSYTFEPAKDEYEIKIDKLAADNGGANK